MLNFLWKSTSSTNLFRATQENKNGFWKLWKNERDRLVTRIIHPKVKNFFYDLCEKAR